ncbi:MAG TPA: SDR family oxidoreductase [Bryobacteraceae bacterium]|nr:SDR family oxidoreductase [Bryobacteraceae bacterium]
MNNLLLEGKTALVTGGGRGIGKAIAHRFAAAGANVAIASRKLENLEATARQFAGLPGRIEPIACHLGRAAEVEDLVRQIETRLGPVDILVNNSATNPAAGPALAVTDVAFLKTIEINTLAALRLVRLTVPKMIERGGGVVINIASVAGLRPQPNGLVYSFTKAGLIMMTRSWALEFGKDNVRVNAIAPGLIRTDFSAVFWKNEEILRQRLAAQALPRLGLPEEVASMALHLASSEASFVTGQTFVVDGGETTR